MKCSQCGNELKDNERYCSVCGTPVEPAGQGVSQAETWSQPETMTAPGTGFGAGSGLEGGEPPKSKKKTGIIIGAVAAAAVAVGGLVFAMNQKDPKEIVIAAFENICPEGQVSPMEELFGSSAFMENAKAADAEASVTVVMDSCSDSEVDQFSGSGFRITGKYDKTNKRGAANIGVIYKDMDLANLDGYFDESAIMVMFPELSSRVFTIDISDGLTERIKNSPILGPALEYQGIDVEGFSEYMESLTEQIESGENAVLDFEALMTRYREGTQAQEKFKEALMVEKGEKGTFLIDGQEAQCSGYKVTVSKESMMEFLRSTTDFFLNDQELKDQYLKQLEQSVKMAELMGGGYAGITAADLYDESVEDITGAVEEMIDFLDNSLTDVNMEVYVDKKGRLAAVMGTTVVNGEDMDEPVNVAFDFRLQGGSYLTQNMTADITLTQQEEIKLSMIRQGTYDGKRLTCDISVDLSMDGADAFDGGVVWTGTYDSEGGDYNMGLSVTSDNELMLELSLAGVVDELEKGTVFHTDVDQFKIDLMDGTETITFSGEYSYRPLSEELSPLEGEAFDVLAAGEEEWQSVFMEFYMGVMRLMSQLSL